MALRISRGLRDAMMDRESKAAILAIAQITIAFVDDGSGPNGGDLITGTGLMTNAINKGQISVYGSASNNGTLKVLSHTADQIEVPAGSLTAESAGASVTLMTSIGGAFTDLFRNGVMKIFPGTQPASADVTEGVTELVEIVLGGGPAGTFVPGADGDSTKGINFGDDAVSGVIGKDALEVWSGEASQTNTAGWFRFYDSNRTTGASTTAIRFDGAISTAGAQLNMSNTTITSGGTTTIDSVAVTLPTQ